MKILYGIQGTGNGHLARARALVPELIAQGHELDFVFSGRKREDFFNMEVFGDDFKVFDGATLVTRAGQLDLKQTWRSNDFLGLFKAIKQLDLDGYDLVLSDFEPITAWAAKLRGKTSMSISHQAAFHYDIPKVSGHKISQFVTSYFAPTTHALGLHWHHFNQAILPPMIEPLQAKPIVNGKYLVYMGFEDLSDIIKFLMPFQQVKFEVFAKVDSKKRYGHITVNPLSHVEFHRHLSDCEGVIANAGFELASECLHLGKKILVKPVLGQYEQLSNALALQGLGAGSAINRLDSEALRRWLEQPAKAPNAYPNVAKAIACWLNEGNWDNVKVLSEQLWAELPTPYTFEQPLKQKLQFA